MLIKATKSYIDLLRNSELKGKHISDFKQREEIAYHVKSGANWYYRVYAIIHESGLYAVAVGAQNTVL